MGGAGVVTLPWVGAGTWILVLVVALAVAATAGAQWSRVAIEDHTALAFSAVCGLGRLIRARTVAGERLLLRQPGGRVRQT